MALRSGHGLGRGKPHIEALPVDQLPKGVPRDAEAAMEGSHDERGKFAKGNKIAALGGKAKYGYSKLAHVLGIKHGAMASGFREYRAMAVSFRKAQCSELARTVGGGICGPGPSSLVASAALQLAWARYFSDLAMDHDDPELVMRASRLSTESRQNLLAAHELCAREAEARPRPQINPLAALMAAQKPDDKPR